MIYIFTIPKIFFNHLPPFFTFRFGRFSIAITRHIDKIEHVIYSIKIHRLGFSRLELVRVKLRRSIKVLTNVDLPTFERPNSTIFPSADYHQDTVLLPQH